MNEKYQEACACAERDLPRNMPALCAIAKATKCQWYSFYAYKLTELHDWCLANQPRTILELGSGWTTLIMARYAAEFSSRLVTVEESKEWRETGPLSLLPDWARVEWHMSPRVIENKMVRYASLPQLDSIDLLYVDGPSSDCLGGSEHAGADAVRLVESGVAVKHMLVDIRNATVDYIRDSVGDRYGFEPGGTYKWSKPWYLRPMRHHSWFWRK